MKIPAKGLPANEILQTLSASKQNDIPWKSGKVLAYVYEPDASTYQLTQAAYMMYLTENALDPTAFPSVLKLENEMMSMAADLLGGNDQVVGNFTSGGTESIILAVKTARDYFRDKRPEIEKPELIVAETAHAAFHKAAHYLGLNIKTLPVDPVTFKLSIEQVREAINPNTILLVGSAPSYAHGVIDPIEDLAKLALEHKILCHVDACVGGMYLPFANKMSGKIPPFEFSVEGVSSMSCDFHKYGYAAKGASCVLYKNKQLRKYQLFACSSWSGYSVINPTVLSSKTAGPLAGAWATLHHIGMDGYMEIVKSTQLATQAFMDGISQIEELSVLGEPIMNLVAVKSNEEELSVFSISDAMSKRGWHIQVQMASSCSPEALHLSINRANTTFIPQLIQDLKAVIKEIKSRKVETDQLDLSMIMPMIDHMNDEMFDQMSGMLGLGQGSALPENMEFIHKLINALNPDQRDKLLKAFINKMFSMQ